ncbi:TetR/AcrR family transcriptional regulator [Acidaminobacter sp. JC074]|uniref:TetR/AcrR family transcriptional regulator n=1 Tax=Acidaminobacter sp. JC074 TaxID=2530199 RepID=UPI001F0EFC8F|nr:TetR/AcrR family transcriptional regulator [Acidaminobacter sp. JC074]
MPKIIKDLRPQIKKTALEEFENIGYEAVTMRKLAGKVGIGVGTLYNYFSNKEDLFEEILLESWQKTAKKIRDHLDSDLITIISILYDDIVNRKGLGGYVIQFEINDTNIDSPLKELFHQLILDLSEYFKKKDISFPERKAYSSVLLIANVIKLYPNEKEKNIEYFYHLIKE